VTAAIGILVGIGFYFPAILGAAITLAVLAVFRMIESKLPTEFYSHHLVRFQRQAVMGEDDLRKLIGGHGFSVANLSSRLTDEGKFFEYRMTIRSRDRRATEQLSQHLRSRPEVIEFRITPIGE
jgi:putative Mg2+ transporter-C (MgtC) family protein